jgi:methionyl-tRNA formyltransferase
MNPNNIKLVVFGMYQFGTSVLEKLWEAGYDIRAIVTKPFGKGQIRPLQCWAKQHRIPCLTPVSPREPAFIAAVRRLAPDFILVAGYHRIIPAEVLDIPYLGAFNLHASLLPRYRGPCPQKWALINGETQTGLTVHQMVPELDSGPIYSRVVVSISDDDDAQTLFIRLCAIGAELLCITLEQILNGTCSAQPQDESLATYQGYPQEKDCRIDWMRPAAEIRNLIRGLFPSPGAWTSMEEKRIRIWKATIGDQEIEGPPGRIVPRNGKYLATTATDNLILEQWSYEIPCPERS